MSVYVNLRNVRHSRRMAEQAMALNALAPNLRVKIPCTKAGLQAIEEATSAGVSVHVTMVFSVAQALQAA